MTTSPTSTRRARRLWPALVITAGLTAMACGSEAAEPQVSTAPADPADAEAPAPAAPATPATTAAPAAAVTEEAGESGAPAASAPGADAAPAGSSGEGAAGGETDTSAALGDPDDGSPPEKPTPEPYGPDDGVSGGESSSSSEDSTDGVPPASPGETDTTQAASPPADGNGSPDDALDSGADDATAVSPENPVTAGNGATPAEPPPPPPPPVDTRPRGPIRIDDVQFLVREKFPMSVAAVISGGLPNPCHEVAWEVTSQGSRYEVTVWSVDSAEEMACITVEEPFTAQVELGDDFLFEDYTVVVNGTAHALDF